PGARRHGLHQRDAGRPAVARRQALRDWRWHLRNPPLADRPRALRRVAMTMSELLETYLDEATWNLFAAAGVTTAFLKENRRGMAAVQQNITYRRELLVHEMRNAVTGEIS